MALSIKNPEVEKLVEEVAAATGETKTEAVRRALIERRARLTLGGVPGQKGLSFLRYLEEEVWPNAPREQLGRRLTRTEEDQILGYGEDGV